MLWWLILATVLTVLIVIFNSDVDSLIGFGPVCIFGSDIWQKAIACTIIWVTMVFSFWVSAISFTRGWDAVADFARWLRRMKTNSLVRDDIVKLRDLMN